MDFVIPDSVEPVVGWRAWIAWVTQDDQLRLRSLSRPYLWPPGGPLQAWCGACITHTSSGMSAKRTHELVAPPAKDGACGIYAVDHPARVPASFCEFPVVFGKVNLWGKIVPGEHGWRAQYAYPAEFYLPPYEICDVSLRAWTWGALDQLSIVYGVPLQRTIPDELNEYHVKHWVAVSSARRGFPRPAPTTEGGKRSLYVGRDGKPISQDEAVAAFDNPESRIVASHHVNGHHVSTVWLVIDHGFAGDVIPFETMIFCEHQGNCVVADFQERYSTEGEARAGHARNLRIAQDAVCGGNTPSQQQKPANQTEGGVAS